MIDEIKFTNDEEKIYNQLYKKMSSIRLNKETCYKLIISRGGLDEPEAIKVNYIKKKK